MKKTKLFAAFCAAAAGIMLFSASVFADDVLGSHSFDGGTDNGSDIVFKGTGFEMGSLAEEEGNYFIRISGQNNWNNLWYKPTDTSEKIDAFWEDTSAPRKLQVEFDIRDSIGNGRIWVTLGADDQDPVGHGVRILTTTADGNVGIADEGGNSRSRLKTGGLEANVWYHYTFTIDIDNKTVDATLSDGENTYTVTDLDLYTEQQWTGWWIEGYTREPFNVIGFGIPGTPHNVDIDNVKFTRIAEEEEEPEPDSDILGSHSFDGGTDNGSKVELKGGGNYLGSLAEEDGNYFIRISGQNNWDNFWYKPTGTTEKIDAFWEDTSVPRKMQVEFDIRDSIGNGRIWVSLGTDDRDPLGRGIRILATTADGNVGIADEGGNSRSRLKTGGLEPNVWYHYTFTLDIDNKTADATLSDGENTYTVTDLDLYTDQQWPGWWIEDFTYEPFDVIGFTIPGTPHNVDIDNVKFTRIAEEEEEPEPDSDILGSHSFDGGTDNGSDIVFKGNGVGMGSLAEEEGNYFIRISGQNNWNNFWYKPADTTEKIDAFWEDTSVPRKMQVEFDIRDSIGNGRIWVSLGTDDRDPLGRGIRILATTADGNVGIADEGGNSRSRLKTGGLEPNVWYHYTFTLDIDNKTADATLSDGENTYTVTDLDLYTDQQWPGWWIEGFTYEPFDVIGFTIPGTPHNVDIDNIVFKKIVAAPSVSADKITISAGSAVQGAWTNVSASADKIAIDFGTEMDISSLTDNVYIINKQTQEKVAAEGRLDKSIYTLNLTQQLEKDTEYTIFIGKDAANTTGMALGADYSFDFRTDAGRINVNIDSVEKSGEAVTSLSQLAENDSVKLNISYTNSTNEAQSFYVIVAYYNGSQMVRVSLIPISRDAGVTSEQIGIDYKVPEIDGADSAKVMCWDNFTQIRPLGEFLNL